MTAFWTVKRETERPSLEDMQEFVDGRIELILLSSGDHLVINEEGLLDGLPINQKATNIWWNDLGLDRSGIDIQRVPPLVGDIILVEGGLTNEQRNDSQTKARVQKKVLDRGIRLVQYRIINLLNMAWVLLYVIKSLVHFV